MKIKSTLILIALTLYFGANWAVAFDTAITYQGQLLNSGSPANGTYNMIFTLFNNSTGTGTPAATVPVSNVLVSDGLFTVPIPFDPSLFAAGTAYWLQIQVEPSGGSFSTLSPLQPLTTVPYALFTETSGALSGTLPAAQLIGTIPLAQLPATVLTENESGILATLTLSGTLEMPATQVSPDIIYSGTTYLLYADNNGNFFSGQQAGASTTTTSGGMNNTGSGVSALASNTSGSDNAAYGFNALFRNINGFENTAVGSSALYNNTVGYQNTAVGYVALDSNTNGWGNTAIGYGTLSENTSGSGNTAIGWNALVANTNGGNTAVGFAALDDTLNGSQNTAGGGYALYLNTSGSQNTAFGYEALQNNTNGSFNIALGYFAGFNLATGSYNIDVGNEGVAGDNNVIRIGTQGTETNTFIAGIYNTPISGGIPVVVNSSGQLGSSSIIQGQSLQIGMNNTATGKYATVTGGTNNTVNGNESAVLGGYLNVASGPASSVTGGSANTASGDHSIVSGGRGNTASGTHSFVGAGLGNSASSDEDAVVSGISNSVAGDPAFIGAGQYNTVGTFSGTGKSGIAVNSFIVAGIDNTVYSDNSGIGGGGTNYIGTNANSSFIGGGSFNNISSGYSVIGGGSFNNISSSYSVIGGGLANIIGAGANNASLGGGSNNLVSGVEGTVPGGGNNIAGGFASFAAGEGAHAVNNGTFVWSDGSSAAFTSTANNQFLIQATNGVGIGETSPAGALHITGPANTPPSSQPSADNGLVLGTTGTSGYKWIQSFGGSLALNPTSNKVGIGTVNPQQELGVAGGVTIDQNGVNNGTLANAITFGAGNTGEGIGSQRTSGASQASLDFYTDFADRMIILQSGNVGIGTTSPTAPLHVANDVTGGLGNPVALVENTDTTTSTGPALRVFAHGSPTYGALTVSTGIAQTSGATTVLLASFGNATKFVSTLDNNGNWLATGSITANAFISVSDRNAKENFQDVSAQDVLNKVATLPMTRWNFKQDTGVQHIGPMAQDFQAAFRLSADDKHISLVDEGGVALAAIQGLNQKLGEKDTEIQTLKQQNDSLAARLNELEAAVKQLAAQK